MTEPLVLAKVRITSDDRMAAIIFLFGDAFAGARRAVLWFLGALLLAALLMMVLLAWGAVRGQGPGALAQRLASDLLGFQGRLLLVLAAPVLLYHALHPMLVRRRLARWLRDEGLALPECVELRFEPAGLVWATADWQRAAGCQRVAGVVHTTDHLMIRLSGGEDVLAVPRAQLSPTQLDGIEDWAQTCHAGAQDESLPVLASSADATRQPLVSVRFTPTEANRTAAVAREMERPGARHARRRALVLALLSGLLFAPVMAVVLWALDSWRVPLRHAAPLWVEMFAADFWRWTLALWAVVGVVALLHPTLRRWHAHRRGRQLHRSAAARVQDIRFFDDGIEVVEDGWRERLGWTAFSGFERRGDDLFLALRDGGAVQWPVAALDGAFLARLERLIDERLRPGASPS